MPPTRDLWPAELAIVHKEAPRAVARWARSSGLEGRLSPSDRQDLSRDLVDAFCDFWSTGFEWGACLPMGEPTPKDIDRGIRAALRGLSRSVLPDLMEDRGYGGAVCVTRYGCEQDESGAVGAAVEYDGERDHRRDDGDPEAALVAGELRKRIVTRLLELAATHDDRPAWWRGLELAAGATVESLMVRDGLTKRQVYWGTESLQGLFARDAVLSAAVESVEGGLGEALTGFAAEVIARASRTAAPSAEEITPPATAEAPAEAPPVIAFRPRRRRHCWLSFPSRPAKRPARPSFRACVASRRRLTPRRAETGSPLWGAAPLPRGVGPPARAAPPPAPC